MGSLRLVAVEGGTGAGSHNIPVAIMSDKPSLSNVRTRTNAYDGKVYTNARASTRANTQYIGGGTSLANIQSGYYWLDSPGSGYQIYIGTKNDETGHTIAFGPIKVWGSIYGETATTSGSGEWPNGQFGIYSFTHDTYGEIMCLGYTNNPDGALPASGFYNLYCFGFDGVGSLVSDNPYTPPSGQAGSDSSAGGGGAGGAGYPTGINTDTPDNKKNRAGVGCDIYLCSPIAVKAFTKMLWGSTNTGFIDAFFKRVQNAVYNPVDSIITCHSLPSAFAPTGGTQATGIKAGGVDFSTYDEACVGQIVANEWVHSGPYTYACEECWGNYSDYRDTKVSLYLPFCGIVPLDTSLFLSYQGELRVGITVDYWCNVLNGNCAAFIKTQDRFGDTKLIKVATGNCAQPCPISGNDRGMQQKLGSLFGFGQSVLSAASGGSPIQIMAGVASGALGVEQAFYTAPHHTEVVGSLNGAAGFAAATDIQIIFDIPIPINSGNYSLCRGRPSEVSRAVGEYSGHCELELHADSVNYATDEEKREIERICLNGILI